MGHLLARNWSKASIRPDVWHPFLLEGRAQEAIAMILTPRSQRPGPAHPFLPSTSQTTLPTLTNCIPETLPDSSSHCCFLFVLSAPSRVQSGKQLPSHSISVFFLRSLWLLPLCFLPKCPSCNFVSVCCGNLSSERKP